MLAIPALLWKSFVVKSIRQEQYWKIQFVSLVRSTLHFFIDFFAFRCA